METPTDNPAAEEFNYFRYFTEVEEEFVRRRGSHMLVSPIDWALIESWKEIGVPLPVVLRGINVAFDGYDSRGGRIGKVNSILYCQQAVEECFAEFRLSRVGDGGSAGAEGIESEPDAQTLVSDSPGGKSKKKQSSSFSRDDIFAFLQVCELDLGAAADHFRRGDRQEPGKSFVPVIERAAARLAELRDEVSNAVRVDPEKTEVDLTAVDRMILDHLRSVLGPENLAELKKEAKAELRGYKTKMDKAIYEQTVENFVCRRLREIGRIPRLSLFYLF